MKYNVKPTYRADKWVFDNGATQHLAGDKRYFVNYRDLSPQESEKATIHGYNGKSSPVGIGSIDMWVQVQESPPEKTNLFSQSVATEQGFQIAYDDASREYMLIMNGEVALHIEVQPCKLWIFTAENGFLSGKTTLPNPPTPQTMINYAISDGVSDLQCWHEKLGHFCLQFVMQTAGQSLVEGTMLRKRKFDIYEACQLGNSERRRRRRRWIAE